jgi:para-nitrobenzyl esterase
LTDIRIEQGLVRGDQRDGVFRFRGLPYAAAPVGERRWAPPAPPERWDGVREATEFGPAAIQFTNVANDLGAEPSEDCLNLNIWSPTLDSQARLPVMVWVHGGGFVHWSASMKGWHGRMLSARGVVVVSLNFRLGALGFLAHPRTGANFAVQDWVAALRWVAENIASFGGDPGNVTIFGQSAGADAVRTLLGTPSANGLFHRAILQSAGFEPRAVAAEGHRAGVTRVSEAFFEQLGGNDLDYLRALPIETLRAAAMTASITGTPGQARTPGDLAWRPFPDGQIVGEDLSSWDPGVPVLFGSTEDEARFFFTPTGSGGPRGGDPVAIYTPATLASMAQLLGGERAQDILDQLTGNPYEALTELFTAGVWTEPLLASYRRFTQIPRIAFAYRFARVSPANRASGLLAHHCAELAYVFGRVRPGQYDDADAAVSDAVMHAWTTFARDGVPRHLDGAAWPSTSAVEPSITLIEDTVRTEPLRHSSTTTLIESLRVRR